MCGAASNARFSSAGLLHGTGLAFENDPYHLRSRGLGLKKLDPENLEVQASNDALDKLIDESAMKVRSGCRLILRLRIPGCRSQLSIVNAAFG